MVSNMNRRITRRAFHFVFPLLALGGGSALSRRGVSVSAVRDLSELLETQRQREALPAVAAAIIHRGEVVARGVSGLRQLGTEPKVEIGARWHIGSCTKSMTATMIGVLVEKGALSWNLTIPEALPALGQRLHPDYRHVTLEMLLAHRGGINHEWDIPGLWNLLWQREDTPVQERRKMTEVMLSQPPKVSPGRYFYSNCSFGIAGHIAETILGQSWEKLMQELVFQPLDMSSAGYGVPWSSSRITDPWPHREDGTPVTPGPMADNPPSLGPGGTVHVSILDWAKYIADHLRGARAQDGILLRAATYARLHRGYPMEGSPSAYALGWMILQRDWARGQQPRDIGRCLHHGGSNNSWYALVWIAPERNSAFLCTTNIGGHSIFPKIDTVIGRVIQGHLHNFAER